jgi:hypothetical protein
VRRKKIIVRGKKKEGSRKRKRHETTEINHRGHREKEF